MAGFLQTAAQFAPGAGAALGTAFGGPVGSAIGGLGGAGLGSLLNWLGAPEKQGASENDFLNAQKGLLGQLQQQQPFQSVSFDPIKQEYMRQFEQSTLPGIHENFASNPYSSSYRNAITGAKSDLATRLAGLQAQHEVGQQQARLGHGNQQLSQLGQLQNLLSGQQLYGLKSGEQTQENQRKILESLMGQFTDYGAQQRANQTQGINAAQGITGAGLGQQFENIHTPGALGAGAGWAKAAPQLTAEGIEFVNNLIGMLSGGVKAPGGIARGAVK